MTNIKAKKRLLLLSAYDAKSHQHWRHLLQNTLDQYDWTQIALPDRHFSWRVRGNSLTYATQYHDLLSKHYDALIVTSMVDLSALRGFVPSLAKIPTLNYFHENQFDYPASVQREFDANRLNAQLTSIYSLICADTLLFNSQYNQDTFFSGANALLKKMPDGVNKRLLDDIQAKSKVLAVPIHDHYWSKAQNRPTRDNHPIEIVWNHRWEYDKQPQVLFDALILLQQAGVPFKLHLLGQSFRKIPECFAKAKAQLAEHIATWGYQPNEKYQQILHSADIVVSTAIHDFQGLSMLEAIAAGCFAIAPNRVAYPEYIPAQDLYSVVDGVDEAQTLSEAIKNKISAIESGKLGRQHRLERAEAIKRYACASLIGEYCQILERLIDK